MASLTSSVRFPFPILPASPNPEGQGYIYPYGLRWWGRGTNRPPFSCGRRPHIVYYISSDIKRKGFLFHKGFIHSFMGGIPGRVYGPCKIDVISRFQGGRFLSGKGHSSYVFPFCSSSGQTAFFLLYMILYLQIWYYLD